MIFTSFEFVVFFVVVVACRSLLRSFSAEKWLLLVASYLFYMSWSIPCGLLILTSSLVDYFVGQRLVQTDIPSSRKRWVALSVVVNLGMVCFFKYTNFLTANAGWGLRLLGYDTSGWHFDIILPVGVSFFTFQSMSHTLDVYRRKIVPCGNIRDYLLFVSFFPQLVAGPIVRAADFLPQLAKRVRASAADIEAGLAQFALGAVKKMVISDQVAPNVDLIFANPGNYDGFTLLQGVLGYGIQIYCDFSGYSDMAIGSARMMGFKFMENFQMPYSATTITEFWQRWHISLSSWFRDYLYIPLGGNRKGPKRTYVNLLVTMLLCGLWHGASWNFVFWGGLHGVALAIHRAWKAWNPLAMLNGNPAFQIAWNIVARVLTLAVVLVGWIFFRATSWASACDYLHRMASWHQEGTRLVSPQILPALMMVVLVHLLVNKDRNWALELPQRSVPVRIVGYTALALLLVCLGATDAAPFIYFQF
jgi:alginate O-acetyltransferase complex protein AlgI